jgi:glycosyltransferase involved in cell wall biosynthesis
MAIDGGVSIVIPSYGRPQSLRRCLESLGREHEVIVVDDGSPERVPEGLLGARVIRQDNRGPAAARNRGAAEARGKFLAFLDDDCVALPGWLEAAAAAWRPGRLVGCRVENLHPENRRAAHNQISQDALTDWWMERGSSWRFLPSSNWVLEREAFLGLGGFSLSFPGAAAEDREFCGRWCDTGGELHCVQDRLIGHHHPQSLRQFAKMHFRYGRGARILRRLRPQGPVDRDLYRHLREASPSQFLFAVSQVSALSGLIYESSRSFLSSGKT